MQAMILAAGLGTRLKPITNDIPKALVEINGKTLLEITIRKLIENDFRRIIINVHHFADKIKEFLDKSENINITYSGLGNIPISIGNKDIYDKDKFAQKFKENFQYFLDDYDNCSQYLKLMNALYDPYFISVRLFIPEGVVVENDENIFL